MDAQIVYLVTLRLLFKIELCEKSFKMKLFY